jgi:hypothetical protein
MKIRTLNVENACRTRACIEWAALVGLLLLSMSATALGASLPCDRTNPFIWDNDSETDVYALTLVMAMAHLGELKLIGISQSPHPYKTTSENYQTPVNAARNSGWTRIPDPTWNLGGYYMTAVSRPASGNVNDTVPLNTAPAQMIRDRVLAYGTAAKPVVIGTGGALTTVASAYLLAKNAGRGPEFSSKCVVYFGGSFEGTLKLDEYNCDQDQWALHVCLISLRTVLMQYRSGSFQPAEPNFMSSYVDTLPNTSIGNHMKWIKTQIPAGYNKSVIGDVQAILALMFPNQGNYFNSMQPVSFNFWSAWPGGNGYTSGPNSLNWGAYQAILNIKLDGASQDLRISNYNQSVPISYCKNIYNRAFGANAPPPNTSPTVSLTSPANGSSFTAPATITVSANASDSNGTVSKVEFLRNGVVIGTDTTSPYSWIMSGLAASSYTLAVRATDNAGGVTTSGAISITVKAPTAGNTPPSVSLTSPANGWIFTAPATITVSANASDSNGTVSKVEFLRNGVVIGTDTTSPYSWIMSNLAASSYTLAVRAMDNAGAVTTSGTVGITVKAVAQAPTPTPSPIPTSVAQTPFGGTPMAIPGSIVVSRYDNGGEGVAYHDIETANLWTSTYRAGQGVESDGTGIGWAYAGEWLEYTVHVASGGIHTMTIPVANPDSGGSMHVRFNGVNVTGSLAIPNTGSWNTFTNLTKSVNLNAGTQVMRVSFDGNSSMGAVCNLKDIGIAKNAVAQAPTSGLLVNFGSTASATTFSLPGWNTAITDVYTTYRNAGPGGTMSGFNGGYDFQGVKGTAGTFAAGQQIVVTWYNTSASARAVTPWISMNDPDRMGWSAVMGTWRSMSTVTVPAFGTATSQFTFTSATAGSYSVVNVSVNTDYSPLICDKIVLVTSIALPPTGTG